MNNVRVNGAGAAWRRGAAVASVICLIAAAAAWRLLPPDVPAHIDAGLHRVRDLGVAGSLAFALMQALIAVSGLLPASLLGIAAGALYGPLAGFTLTALGTLAGAWLAFVLARSARRPMIAQTLHRRRRLHALDLHVSAAGWRFVALLRLSPVMPFALTSYALGLSSVRPRDYLLGTLACLPALFGYVLIGVLSGAGLAQGAGGVGLLRAVLSAAGAAATLALTVWIGKLAAEALKPARAPRAAGSADRAVSA